MGSRLLPSALLLASLLSAQELVRVEPVRDTLSVEVRLPSVEGAVTLTLPELINDATRRIVYTDSNLKSVNWRREPDGSIRSSWRREGVAAYELGATPERDGLRIHWTITNLENTAWQDAAGNICMRSHGVPDLFDPTGERILLRSKGHWVPVREAWSRPGSNWFLPPGLDPLPLMRPHLGKGGWSVAPLHPDEAIIAVQSRDGRYLLAQAWHRARYTIANVHDRYVCTEAAPSFGEIGPKETIRVTGMIYWFKGSTADLESRYRADLVAGKIALRR